MKSSPLRTDTISFRVPHVLRQNLDDLAQAMDRRRSDLLISWITEKIELERWQLAQVDEGLAQLDKGQFATEAQLKKMNKKWGFKL